VPETSDSLEIFSYVFWQWDQYHLQRQSDLFVRTPINRNPRYPKQIARNRFLPTHLTSLIRKPRCPTPSRKFRNGYVIPVEKKRWTGLRQLLLNCLLNHNGRVKVYFPRTMNVTVADPAGRSYRSPVQFFSFESHSECILAHVCGSANKQKQLWEFHFVIFHMQCTYLLKLTVRLTLQFVSVSPLNVRLGQTCILGLKVWGHKTFLGGQDFCFYYIF